MLSASVHLACLPCLFLPFRSDRLCHDASFKLVLERSNDRWGSVSEPWYYNIMLWPQTGYSGLMPMRIRSLGLASVKILLAAVWRAYFPVQYMYALRSVLWGSCF